MESSKVSVAGVWKENLDFGSIPPRCSHTATMIDRCMYIIGGGIMHEPTNQFIHHGDVWKVDFQAKTQTKLSICKIEGRRGHSAVVFRGRYIVVFGGYKTQGDQETLSDDLLIIDTVTEKVLDIHDMHRLTPQNEFHGKPSPRRGHMAAMTEEGRLLVLGGDADGDLFNSDNSFIYSAQLSCSPDHISSCNSDNDIDSLLLEFGVFVLWTRHELQGKLPIRLALSAYAQSGSELLIYGGSCIAVQQQSFIVSSQISPSLYVLDLSSFELTNITGHIIADGQPTTFMPLSPPRYCSAMAIVSDCVVVIYGGSTQQGENLSDLLLLHAPPTSGAEQGQSSQSWRNRVLTCTKMDQTALSPSPRNAMSLVSYDRGSPSLIMFGGGVFPNPYFRDMWTLNLLTSSVGSVFERLPSLPQFQSSESCMSMKSYFEICFEDKRHADVDLLVHSDYADSNTPVIIPAHKLILAAKSSYFRSLFDGGWADSGQGGRTLTSDLNSSVNLTETLSSCQQVVLDVRETAFRHVLQFLYTDKLNGEVFTSQESAVDVLQCSSMLSLTECKLSCERELAWRYLMVGTHISPSAQHGDAGGGGCESKVKVAHAANELTTLEQQAAYMLSIADTFHCELLAAAALEQIRLCRHVLSPTDCLPPPPPQCSDDKPVPSAVLYAEFFESLSPDMAARLRKALDPASVLYSPHDQL